MRSIYILAIFFTCSVRLNAQQNHFIYIQTENKQAFYVRVGDKLLSSSSSGYMIIPRLQNGNYEILVGFPKNEWPQQRLNVTVNNKDVGYLLKNFDSKGWGLFNMQTLDVTMPFGTAQKTEAGNNSKNDGFADALADVVSTPSIKKTSPVNKSEEPVVKKEPDKPEEKKPVAEKISVTPAPATISKITTTLDADGRSAVYTDNSDGKTDTIRIFIPYKQAMLPVKKETTEQPAPVKKEEPVAEIKPEPKEDKKTVVQQPVVKEAEQPKPVVKLINSDCKQFATQDDFLKLRKKMAAQKSEENMVVMAKKTFVTTCFTTDQVANLSVLFLKDDGRYSFFDAAYPHISDTENFSSLVSKLSDEYYINRFKAMIRH
ncbi:MAG: DUF4476 domain-containing protein [Ferruginibacter sp.]